MLPLTLMQMQATSSWGAGKMQVSPSEKLCCICFPIFIVIFYITSISVLLCLKMCDLLSEPNNLLGLTTASF